MLIWLFIIILAIIIELLTVDLVSLWIIIGGFAGLLLAFLHMPVVIQWIGFIVVTLVIAVLVKPFGKEFLRGNIVKTNIDRYIGKQAVLTKSIQLYEPGELTMNGETWRAISSNQEEIEAGQEVTIVRIDGNKLIVRK